MPISQARATSIRLLWDDAEFQKDGPIKLVKDAKIRRVVMCTGKVYYDLLEEREKRGIDDVYLLRVEQLYPFPAKALINILSRFRNAEMVWCQEEPKNMGAWSFIDPYLEWVLAHIDAKYQKVRYTGRPAAASPATGLMSKHLAQLAAFLEDALGADRSPDCDPTTETRSDETELNHGYRNPRSHAGRIRQRSYRRHLVQEGWRCRQG